MVVVCRELFLLVVFVVCRLLNDGCVFVLLLLRCSRCAAFLVR